MWTLTSHIVKKITTSLELWARAALHQAMKTADKEAEEMAVSAISRSGDSPSTAQYSKAKLSPRKG